MTNITTPVENCPGFELATIELAADANMSTPHYYLKGATVWFRQSDTQGMADIMVIGKDGDWNGAFRIVPAGIVRPAA